MRWIIAALALLGTSALAAQSSKVGLAATPAAMSLFDRDWVLMNWALKYYDSNHDILLEPDEAKAAAGAFRRIADSDGDGRVTPEEYRAARAFILEHY
jgi:hypothetical protein